MAELTYSSSWDGRADLLKLMRWQSWLTRAYEMAELTYSSSWAYEMAELTYSSSWDGKADLLKLMRWQRCRKADLAACLLSRNLPLRKHEEPTEPSLHLSQRCHLCCWLTIVLQWEFSLCRSPLASSLPAGERIIWDDAMCKKRELCVFVVHLKVAGSIECKWINHNYYHSLFISVIKCSK